MNFVRGLPVGGTARLGWLLAVCTSFTLTHAQVVLQPSGGIVRVQNTDMAVMEAGEPRQDLPCQVTQDKPFLGFDLRFHSGFDVVVPLRELAGNENLLTILFRVVPEADKDKPVYLIQRIRVPAIEEDAKGDAYLQGAFDIGEGKYHVDWLMRDRAERVCSSSWDVEASLPPKDKTMTVMIRPNTVEAVRMEQFENEPAVDRDPNQPLLSVKVLLNFAPQKATASTLRPLDTLALVSMLRTLSRDPRIGKFSLVAFNLNEQKMLYRLENADSINFKALGESVKGVSPGTIELRHLAEKNSQTGFLADLIAKEFAPAYRPDAMIFAGPKAMLDQNVPDDKLKLIGEIDYPVFYMNYIVNPQATPWRDAIGNAVKFLKGTEFTISRPRDLWFAVTEMVNRIVKFRNGKAVASVSGK